MRFVNFLHALHFKLLKMLIVKVISKHSYPTNEQYVCLYMCVGALHFASAPPVLHFYPRI